MRLEGKNERDNSSSHRERAHVQPGFRLLCGQISWNSHSNTERWLVFDFTGQKVKVQRSVYPKSYIWELEFLLGSSRSRNLHLLGSFSVCQC